MKDESTLALHAGWRKEPGTGAMAVPIYQTVAYEFRDTQHAADLFALKELGNIYSRLTNPTVSALAERITALEGGSFTECVSSGQSAIFLSILNLAQSGDNIVSSTNLYGGTHTLFNVTLRRLGIDVRFVDPSEPENFLKATDNKTRAYYGESLPNPKLEAFPMKEIADLGAKNNIPLIIDNTASPLICKPLEHGAAVVVHSLTKYMGGHGSTLGGSITQGASFAWDKDPSRLPLLNQPDPAYHGIVWARDTKPLGPVAYVIKIKAGLLRDIGSVLQAHSAFLILQGIETLPLRIKKHIDNAAQVAAFLKNHSKVKRVIHPSQSEGKMKEWADLYLNGGQSALLNFEIQGGMEAAKQFINSLKLFYHAANLGDARSLAIHPASTTHAQLTEKEQLEAGVKQETIRLSIGIEGSEDLIADLEQALSKA